MVQQQGPSKVLEGDGDLVLDYIHTPYTMHIYVQYVII